MPSPSENIISDFFPSVVGGGVKLKSVNTLLAIVLNSNSSKTAFKSCRFTSLYFSSSSLKSTGTSKTMVASIFESLACSAFSSTLCLNFSLFISLVFSSIFSMEPNCSINFWAVFSPTPGTPGILSTASPQSPRMSINCSGSFIPYFWQKSALFIICAFSPIRAGLYI